MVAEQNDLNEQNYKVTGKWSRLAHVCWEGWEWAFKGVAWQMDLTLLLHGRLHSDHATTHNVAECGMDKLIHGRLHNDHSTIHNVAECGMDKLIHGRLHNDHATTHNVAECGTDHVDTRKAAQ